MDIDKEVREMLQKTIAAGDQADAGLKEMLRDNVDKFVPIFVALTFGQGTALKNLAEADEAYADFFANCVLLYLRDIVVDLAVKRAEEE